MRPTRFVVWLQVCAKGRINLHCGRRQQRMRLPRFKSVSHPPLSICQKLKYKICLANLNDVSKQLVYIYFCCALANNLVKLISYYEFHPKGLLGFLAYSGCNLNATYIVMIQKLPYQSPLWQFQGRGKIVIILSH